MDKRMINSSPNPQEEVLIPLLADRDDNFNGSNADGEQDDFNPSGSSLTTVDPEDASGETIPAKPSIFMLLKDPSIRYSILMYAIIQSYNFVYDECFALYARLEHSLGTFIYDHELLIRIIIRRRSRLGEQAYRNGIFIWRSFLAALSDVYLLPNRAATRADQDIPSRGVALDTMFPRCTANPLAARRTGQC